MLYTSPTIHKLEVGDIIQSLRENDLSLFNNEPVIYLGEQPNDISAWDGYRAYRYKPTVVYYPNEGIIDTTGYSHEQLQKMINDEEIEVWTK